MVKKQLKQDKIVITKEVIARSINNWDPLRLFDCCCPPDEYEPEILDIYKMIEGKELNHTSLGRIIFGVFIYYFDTSFVNTLEECINIASQILNYKKN